jgi:hypothetical protein
MASALPVQTPAKTTGPTKSEGENIAMARPKMLPVTDCIPVDPNCSRIEGLAKLGLMSPQILTPDEVRELSRLVLEDKSQ